MYANISEFDTVEEIVNKMDEKQLKDLTEIIDNRMAIFFQREEAEDAIYNAIYDYVQQYGALNISVARSEYETDNQLMIDEEDIKHLLVKHE